MAALTELTFEDWIKHAFAHEVRVQRLAWFWDADIDFWAPQPRQATEYLTRLFTHGPECLRRFTDDQIAQGLTYLVDCSVGMQPDLGDRSIPATERTALWDSVFIFFRDVLMPRCAPELGHLSEPGAALNQRAYMWWEGFPATSAPGDPDQAMIIAAEMRCLASVLRLESVACQEAALHGLGHWTPHPMGGQLAVAIIDDFLASAQPARAELLPYAKAARGGCIQ